MIDVLVPALEYPKTENLYTRDETTHKLTGEFRNPLFDQIKSWLVTEKIDGTNIRIILDWEYNVIDDCYVPHVSYRGRTDAAPVPGQPTERKPNPYGLYDALLDIGEITLISALCQITQRNLSDLYDNPIRMIVFGEGYGAGIQKGGCYSPEQSMRVFDVVTQGVTDDADIQSGAPEWGAPYWRPWEQVEIVADLIGLYTVPMIFGGKETIPFIFDFVRNEKASATAIQDRGVTITDPNIDCLEGVVARTDPYLFDGRGNRIMFKLKGKDLK